MFPHHTAKKVAQKDKLQPKAEFVQMQKKQYMKEDESIISESFGPLRKAAPKAQFKAPKQHGGPLIITSQI